MVFLSPFLFLGGGKSAFIPSIEGKGVMLVCLPTNTVGSMARYGSTSSGRRMATRCFLFMG